mmetsp:Transcript_24809/g.38613  ORF Transcript_24809/g.38613 Transcript_24809/m.38613 type:complete len:122 (+) Transcript_24809:348-713(+)
MPFAEGNMTGIVSDDVVKVGDDIEATMGFGEIKNVTFSKFDTVPISGIIGLNFDLTAIDQLPTFFDELEIPHKSFSFFPKTLPEQSYLTIPGDFDEENYDVLGVHPVIDKKFWTVDLGGLA